MSRGLINRGDLLRSLLRPDADSADEVAAALGYLPRTIEQKHKKRDEEPAEVVVNNGSESPLEDLPDHPAPLKPVPFWQPVDFIPDEIDRPDASKGTAPLQPPTRAIKQPPAYQYLASFKELVPRLRNALSEHRTSRTYDIPRIVDRIGRGETLHTFPRRHRIGWGPNLYVVEDRSDHLAPYVRDQAKTQLHLSTLYPEQGFVPCLYSELETWPKAYVQDAQTTPMNPQPGDQVLVLGDLGCLADDGGHALGFWTRFGSDMQDCGVSAIALIPCSVDECPESVARYYQLLCWEHPAPKSMTPSELEKRGERLLNHLANFPRIEPRLLRDIRLGLGAVDYPARLEAWVWQHSGMPNPDMVTMSMEKDEAKQRHLLFRQVEHRDLALGTLSLARKSLAHLSYELWLETVLNLEDWDETVFSTQERRDGVALLNYLAGRVDTPGPQSLSTRAKGWLEVFFHRLRDEVKDAPETKNACWVLAGYLAQKDQLSPPADTIQALQFYQSGGQFELHRQGGNQALGSPLASLSSVDGLVRLTPLKETAQTAFWIEEQARDWADAWGEDEHGPWAEFVLQEVRQRLRWISPGEFMMGSPDGEPGRWENESPRHRVRIDEGYWLFDTPVTQALWQTVMGDNPSEFQSPHRPVERVSWEDCRRFLQQLNQQIPGLELRLPSDAQWEYACRAGSEKAIYTGEIEILGRSNAPALDPIAWYGGNSGEGFELENGYDSSSWPEKQYPSNKSGTHPVAKKQANTWGLFDMLGNVWEWTADAWHEDYTDAPEDGSVWESDDPGAERVVRGGSWNDEARNCRSACRYRDDPGNRNSLLGFRPARVQVSQAGQVGAQPDGPGAAAQAERADHRDRRGEALELILPRDSESVAKAIPQADSLRLRSDREIITLQRRTKPDWANAMGRDRFGLWAEILLQASQGPVRQRLRWIPPGRFLMGSPEGEPGRLDEYEGPQHEVVIQQGYWLFDTPVTQTLWQAVMGDNPSEFQSPDRPVEQVSWDDCQGFLQQFNSVIPELELCLPNEAQWEYACRAGNKTAIYTGEIEIIGENNGPALDPIAWYGGNSGEGFELDNGWDSSDWPEKQYPSSRSGTHPVAKKQPNEWGLYDMLGNVWEWTADAWYENYDGAPADGSVRESDGPGAGRVVRGGSWLNGARSCRSACRDGYRPGRRDYYLGFRPARVQP